MNEYKIRNRSETLHSLVEHLRSLLGPHASDKLCFMNENRNQNHFLITNDGATFLSTLPLSGASNEVIVRLSKIQDELIGDGTTSVVLLCHAIIFEMNNNNLIFQDISLNNESLLSNRGNHRFSRINRSSFLKLQHLTWKLAKEMIDELKIPFLIQNKENKYSIPIENKETKENPINKSEINNNLDKNFSETIASIVRTSLSSKIVHGTKIIDILVDIFKNEEMKSKNRGYISILTQIGKPIDDSVWFHGGIIQREWPWRTEINQEIQRGIKNPTILVCRIERLGSFRIVEAIVKSKNVDESLNIMEFEEQQTLNIVSMIISKKINVVFQSGRISAEARQELEEHDIVVIDGINIREINRIASLCHTKVVKHNPRDLNDLITGHVNWIGPHSVHEKNYIRIDSSHELTILLNAPTFSMAAEVERSLHDALCVLFKSIEAGFVVPGAGALYIELSFRLRKHALSPTSDDIIVAESIARALESIPAILARNAGLSVTDTLNLLRAEHSKGKWFSGIVNGECPSDARNAMEPSNLFLNILRGTLRSSYVLLFEDVPIEHERENIRDLGLI